MLPINQKRIITLACGAIVIVSMAIIYHIEQISSNATQKKNITSLSSQQQIQQEIPISDQSDDGIVSPINQDKSATQSASKPVKITSPFLSDKPISSYEDGITSNAYIVANIKTGEVYLSRKVDKVLPVASMSKLITAIAGTDTISSSTIITITRSEMNVPPDGSGVTAGEKYSLSELLNPMLLDSSNIAAEAIASSTNRQKFLDLMSSYAWEVGMPHAFFADPTGISPRNHASAQEMFALSQYLYNSRPDILALTKVAHIDIATTTDHGSHSVDSTHPFVKDPRFLGGKTGRTVEAGETMMTLLKMDDGQDIAFIVLGSQYGDREADTRALIAKYEEIIK